MEPALRINKLGKFYGDLHALKGISFDVNKGEFFGFLGPNGAGKTTTINCIIGLANFQKGNVDVFGYDVVKDYRITRALIGVSPQEYNFDHFLGVKEALVYSGGYYGMKKRDAEKRADELLDYFELSKKAKANIRVLSGGMKRRLTIARALMHKPKILVLDEPTAGVDVELRRSLWKFLKKINKEGTTIFLTTHYLEEAEQLCERIGIINHGKIVALDKTDELINKLSSKGIVIVLRQGLDKLPKQLKKYDVKLEKKRILNFNETTDKLDDILKTIHKSNLNICDMEFKRENLEEVFLKLTKK